MTGRAGLPPLPIEESIARKGAEKQSFLFVEKRRPAAELPPLHTTILNWFIGVVIY